MSHVSPFLFFWPSAGCHSFAATAPRILWAAPSRPSRAAGAHFRRVKSFLALLAGCLLAGPGLAADAGIANLSTLARVSGDTSGLVSGFVVGDGTGQTVLIRAAGPALALFGVSGPVGDSRLQLYRDGTLIATNDNWLPADAALVASLAPGAYTAQVSGVASANGAALLEI